MKRHARNSKSGFTLVELLVVIAIIGILVALLLPAVQAAREAARRTQCTNNLRQVGLAFQNHQSGLNIFPSGGWGTNWTGDSDRGSGLSQPGSWQFQVLTYVEQDNLFKQASDGDVLNITATQKTGASTSLQTPVSVFYCPSRRASKPVPVGSGIGAATNANAVTTAGRCDYKANGGDVKVAWSAGPADLASGDAYTGFADMTTNTGLMSQHTTYSIDSITDGTTNTILVAEKFMDSAKYATGDDLSDDRGCFIASDTNTIAYTAQPPQQDKRGGATGLAAGYTGADLFGGPHSGAMITAMCDGSVRSIGFSIDAATFRLLGSIRDGQVIDSSKF